MVVGLLISCFYYFLIAFLFFILQQLVDAKLYELLGERTAADDEKPSRKKKEKPAKVEVLVFPVAYLGFTFIL